MIKYASTSTSPTPSIFSPIVSLSLPLPPSLPHIIPRQHLPQRQRSGPYPEPGGDVIPPLCISLALALPLYRVGVAWSYWCQLYTGGGWGLR
jgi:hypothetical protein